MLVYLALNRITNKVYIGQHKGEHAAYRWNQHIKAALSGDKGCPALYASIRKHGPEAFTLHLLSSYASCKEDLDSQEIQFIAQHNSTDPNIGYNIAIGGQNGGMKGKRQSAKQKAAAAKACRNRIWTKEAREAIGKAHTGIICSEELRHRRAEFMQGNQNVKGKTWKSAANSQRCSNSCWVHKDENSKFVLKSELGSFLASGWRRGRIIKKRRTKKELLCLQ